MSGIPADFAHKAENGRYYTHEHQHCIVDFRHNFIERKNLRSFSRSATHWLYVTTTGKSFAATELLITPRHAHFVVQQRTQRRINANVLRYSLGCVSGECSLSPRKRVKLYKWSYEITKLAWRYWQRESAIHTRFSLQVCVQRNTSCKIPLLRFYSLDQTWSPKRRFVKPYSISQNRRRAEKNCTQAYLFCTCGRVRHFKRYPVPLCFRFMKLNFKKLGRDIRDESWQFSPPFVGG